MPKTKKSLHTAKGKARADDSRPVPQDTGPLERPDIQSPDPGFLVVGLGASAGGFEALESFFDNMPADNGMAFVIVQHLSPDYKSLMVELLSKHTEMEVLQAEENMALAPGHVYLLPPKKTITVEGGRLHLQDKAPKNVLNFPIDIFLRSLADDYGEKAIAVILSGTGSDGTRGLRAVKEQGGLVMAQDATSAKFDGMPRNAIATGLVDYVLPPHEMPSELLRFAEAPNASVPGEYQAVTDETRLSRIFSIVKNHTGVDFTHYKPSTVLRRIERRLRVCQIENLEDYRDHLAHNPAEVQTLYKEFLIGVTRFFRDPEAFDVIEQKVLPELFKEQKNRPLRIWTAGCSTGEEAYSLAIAISDYMRGHNLTNEIKIFATDVDRNALEFASHGRYPESIAADLAPERFKRHFVGKGDSYEVSKQIREMVVFALHNLIKDPPFNKIDLIVCRNMLIYLQPVLQQKVLLNFNFALNEKGFLFLGASETVGGYTNLFKTFHSKWKVYRCLGKQAPIHIDKFSITPVKRRHRREAVFDHVSPHRENLQSINDAATDILMSRYVPPALVVDQKYELLQVFGDVNKYIKLQPGSVSLNVGRLVRKDMTVSLETGIRKVLREKKPSEYREVVVGEGQKALRFNLHIQPFVDKAGGENLVLVTFEELPVDTVALPPSIPHDAESPHLQRIRDLESELQYTKENLQATIEELEATNEELQATNEELLSANEELQSTNEELQSVNEELITVNSEYQSKIQELTDLNNDMDNLLSSTNIGTIFLDRQLRVRKFTPAIRNHINLVDSDISRPLNHISFNLREDEEAILEDASRVIETLIPVEREVQDKSDRWWLLRILPYRTEDNAIRGVVLTFVDITKRVNALESLRHEHEINRSILEASPVAITMVDDKGNLTYANRQAEHLFRLSRDELLARQFDARDWRIAALDGGPFPAENLPFNTVMRTGKAVFDVRHAVKLPNGDCLKLSINSSPLRDAEGNVVGMVSALTDIGQTVEERDRLEIAVSERTQALAAAKDLLDSMDRLVVALTPDGRIRLANVRASQLIGLSGDQLIGRDWFEEFVPADDRETARKAFQQLMAGEAEMFEFLDSSINDARGNVHAVTWHNKLTYSNGNITGTISTGRIKEN